MTKKNTLYFTLAAATMLTGFLISMFFLFTQLSNLDDNLIKVTGPEQVINLTDKGKYQLFIEYDSSILDPTKFPMDELEVSILNKYGEKVDIQASEEKINYTFSERQGTLIAEFDTLPGKHKVYTNFEVGDGHSLGITQNFGKELLKTIGVTFGINGIFGVISIILILIGIRKKSI